MSKLHDGIIAGVQKECTWEREAGSKDKEKKKKKVYSRSGQCHGSRWGATVVTNKKSWYSGARFWPALDTSMVLLNLNFIYLFFFFSGSRNSPKCCS